jgi:hypothetical protein
MRSQRKRGKEGGKEEGNHGIDVPKLAIFSLLGTYLQ